MRTGWRTVLTVPCKLRNRTDRTAQLLRLKKSRFCGVLARPSSCNGTACRRRYSGRSSTPPDRSANYWRQRRSAGRLPDFCTSIRMMPAATGSRTPSFAMQRWLPRLCRGGTMREVQFTRGRPKPFDARKWRNSMSLMQSRVDDGPHNMDGLRFHAQDGSQTVEAFISRKVLDVWADSVEHRGGRQSLFRDQYNVLGKLNFAAIQRIVSAKYHRGAAFNRQHPFVEILFSDIAESGETLDLSELVRESLPPAFHRQT